MNYESFSKNTSESLVVEAKQALHSSCGLYISGTEAVFWGFFFADISEIESLCRHTTQQSLLRMT